MKKHAIKSNDFQYWTKYLDYFFIDTQTKFFFNSHVMKLKLVILSTRFFQLACVITDFLISITLHKNSKENKHVRLFITIHLIIIFISNTFCRNLVATNIQRVVEQCSLIRRVEKKKIVIYTYLIEFSWIANERFIKTHEFYKFRLFIKFTNANILEHEKSNTIYHDYFSTTHRLSTLLSRLLNTTLQKKYDIYIQKRYRRNDWIDDAENWR